jgi:hypothetical protein
MLFALTAFIVSVKSSTRCYAFPAFTTNGLPLIAVYLASACLTLAARRAAARGGSLSERKIPANPFRYGREADVLVDRDENSLGSFA